MRQCVVDGDRCELGAAPPTERATAGGEDETLDPVGPPGVGEGLVRAQALVQRTVLGVDRNDLGSRGTPGLLHDRAGGDERFLVGERQAPSRFECGQGDREPGETDDGVDHGLGAAGCIGQGLGSVMDRHVRRHRLTDSVGGRFGGHHHQRRRELPDLLDDGIDRRAGGNGDDVETVGFGAHDVEGLRPDRSCRSQNRNRRHERRV